MTPFIRQIVLAPPPIDVDAKAWRNAVVAAGGTVSVARIRRVSTFIRALKAAGVWSLLDRLWIFAVDSSTQALIDFVARTTATAVNSPTFTADRGYTFNGTTNYINTNYVPSSGPLLLQDSAHWSMYIRTQSPADPFALMGPVSGGAQAGFNLYNSAGAQIRVNDNPETASISMPDYRGMLAGNRSGATARQAYRNGAAIGAYTSHASQAPLGNAMAIGGWPSLPSYNAFQASELSFGGSLSAGQHAAFYAAIQAYMTAVGAQV